MKGSRCPPDQELVSIRECLCYDPETGALTWLKRLSNRISVGDRAGTIGSGGYRKIHLNSRCYMASNLAWFLQTNEWPSSLIDHQNRVRSDDRWVNLRLANHQQNASNTGPKGENPYKGVTPRQGKFVAFHAAGGRTRYIGIFGTAEEAALAYNRKAIELYGEFAFLNHIPGAMDYHAQP